MMMLLNTFRFPFVFCTAIFCGFLIDGHCESRPNTSFLTEIKHCSVMPDTLGPTRLVIASVRKVENKDDKVYLSDGSVKQTGYNVIVPAIRGFYWIDTKDALAKVLDNLPKNRNTLIYVHGYGHSFNSMARVGKRIAMRYNVNVIMFDWPSKSINFPKIIKSIAKTTPYFSSVINDVIRWHSQRQNGTHLTLMMHSLGNEYLMEMIEQNQDANIPYLNNIILNSPAITCARYQSIGCSNLIKNRVFVMQNPKDKVLKWVDMLLSQEMLGNYLIRADCTNSTHINFGPLVNKEHTYFLGYTEEEEKNPIIFDIYNCLINGLEFGNRIPVGFYTVNANMLRRKNLQ